jgi:hypothetical protein
MKYPYFLKTNIMKIVIRIFIVFFKYWYMLFTGCEVRIEKYFVEVSKTAQGRRPRDVFETETKYFSIRTDLNGGNPPG